LKINRIWRNDHPNSGGGSRLRTPREPASGRSRPREAAELLREELQLMQDVDYLDLRERWLHSPRS